jgi:flagellar biosynthesis/type III secretory pathway ATPase
LENIVYKNSFNPDLSKITVKLIDTDIRDEKDNAVKIYPQLNDYLQQKIKEQKNLAEKVKEVTAFIQKN